MEALYSKLYKKYETLKKKQLSEMEEINKDQETKFLNYVSVAEDVIQHLNNEKGKLSTQIGELEAEVASLRSTKDEQCAAYQKMLLEENEKNTKLSEEVERLETLLDEAIVRNSKKRNAEVILQNEHENSQVRSGEVTAGYSGRMTRKRAREMVEAEKDMVTPGPALDAVLVRASSKDSVKETSSGKDHSSDQQPECSKRTLEEASDDNVNACGSTNCQFQALLEYLVGMKSTINHTEGISNSFLHQSSGYSFSLTWVKKEAEEEPELLYSVITLGTFERVAPEWMRSALMFRTSMCPIFFKRVSQVINPTY